MQETDGIIVMVCTHWW